MKILLDESLPRKLKKDFGTRHEVWTFKEKGWLGAKNGQLFNLTTDQILNYDGKMPKEVVIEDKTAVEQMRLI